MKMGFELNLTQTQKLIMTPELRQAIQILQFNNMELVEYLNNQIEMNPFLEVEEKSLDIKDKREDQDVLYENGVLKDEIDWKDIVEKYDDISYKTYLKNSDSRETTSIEDYVSKKPCLKDHLVLQLGLSCEDDKERQIGEYIIDSLDSKGYLPASVEDISFQTGESYIDVEKAIHMVQGFDPAGVGARNLSECLKIQLKAKGIQDKNAYIMVEKYLDDIAYNRMQKISKELEIPVSRVQSLCDIIKMLEPKPSRGFSIDSDGIKYIVPDVIIRKINEEYVIIVNDSNLPVISINKYYKDLANSDCDKETNKFLNEKLSSSLWLIKSIEQRRLTLYKVVESILKFQYEFFDDINGQLKPMVLKDVADDINVHESTVSRATNGKYVQTPKGLFELKYFFTIGLDSDSSDEGVSTTSVKKQIKEIVDDENHQKPLSDQKIVEILSDRGVTISRRTVAKYRDEMRIPSSSMRRRY